jgi:type III pantothenate kinase
LTSKNANFMGSRAKAPSSRRTSKILLIDVSNSFTKIATASNGKIGKVRKVATSNLKQETFCKTKATLAVISSVVPTASLIIAQSLPCPPVWIDHRVPGGVPVSYPNPRTIGADRLANAAAVAALGKFPAIVVDFGTAVTFDVIDARGRYLGGIIAPGLPTAARALHEKTALLPLTRISTISSSIGKSTGEAIRIGLLLGAVGLVREAVARITREMFPGKKPLVIATGGDSDLVARLSSQQGGGRVIDLVDPLLTLRGLLAIGEKNL